MLVALMSGININKEIYSLLASLTLTFQHVGSPYLLSLFFKNYEDPTDLSNYSHFSLLTIFDNVLEALINAEVIKYLTSHDLL